MDIQLKFHISMEFLHYYYYYCFKIALFSLATSRITYVLIHLCALFLPTTTAEISEADVIPTCLNQRT